MVLRRLDNVGIAVRDLGRALEFYRDRLGLSVESQSERDFFARLGDTGFYVFQTEGPEGVRRTDDLSRNPVGYDHLSFEVEDVDRAYEELKARGVEFLYGPRTVEEWRLRLACFRDPDGNILYIIRWL